MSQPDVLPKPTEVKYFVVHDAWNQAKVVETQAFTFTAATEPSETLFVVRYKPGVETPTTDYHLLKELWRYFGEVGAQLTLNCTYEDDSTFGTKPTACVVGSRLYHLVLM